MNSWSAWICGITYGASHPVARLKLSVPSVQSKSPGCAIETVSALSTNQSSQKTLHARKLYVLLVGNQGPARKPSTVPQ
eukprot:2866608-Amphidinium_carterae.1